MTDNQAKQHWMQRRYVAIVTNVTLEGTTYAVSLGCNRGEWRKFEHPLRIYMQRRLISRGDGFYVGEEFEIPEWLPNDR